MNVTTSHAGGFNKHNSQSIKRVRQFMSTYDAFPNLVMKRGSVIDQLLSSEKSK